MVHLSRITSEIDVCEKQARRPDYSGIFGSDLIQYVLFFIPKWSGEGGGRIGRFLMKDII